MSEEKKEEKKGSENKEANEGREAKETSAKPDEVAELKDRLLRLAAEFDNYKKRVANEAKQAGIAGKAELIKKLIPTLDEFEIAISSINENDKTKKGLEMIYSNLLEILRGEGLSVIETNGKYDPYKHEIILTRESKEKEGTILEVVRKGYEFNGILIRPASVIVAKPISQEDKQNEKTQS